MKTINQVFSASFFALSLRALGWFGVAAGAVAAIATGAGDELRRNVVVLVDVSKSVDPANQRSALRLVAGLVGGEVEREILEQWRFQPDDPSRPAAVNLARLTSPGSGEAVGLARNPARFVISPLGNYDRVKALRDLLRAPREGSPAEISVLLTAEPSPFGATDNSTHISLAEAVVAQTFLGPEAPAAYYLIVISDMFEDCHNSPAKDYADPQRMADLKARNGRVLSGELAFDDGRDGGGRGRSYSADDVEALRFRAERITDLKVGEFTYLGEVGAPRLPVRVLVFAPSVKRSLAFGQSGAVRWILPDKAPAVPVNAAGLDMDGPLTLTVAGKDSPAAAATVEEKCSLILARRLLDVGDLWGRDEVRSLRKPGNYEVKMVAAGEIGLAVEAMIEVAIAVPALRAEDQGHRESSREKPYQVPGDREILSSRIAFVLDPAPTERHTLKVSCGGTEVDVPVAGGRAEVGLEELLGQAAREGGPLHLRAALPLIWDLEAHAELWLELPAKPTVWAEYPIGRRVEGGSVSLERARALTLKASHVGMDGMDWRGTTVTDADGNTVELEGDSNSLDFAAVAAGTYAVEAKFGRAEAPVTANFTVVVPAQTNWMLLALALMAALAIGLLAWHFYRR